MPHFPWRRGWITLTLSALTSALPVTAATLNVTATADLVANNGDCTLREAFQAAHANTTVDLCGAGSASEEDVIQVPAGTYTLTAGELVVSGQALRLRGPAVTPLTTVIDANLGSRALKIDASASVTLEHLVITQGSAGTGPSGLIGGGILCLGSSLTLRDVELNDNLANAGGGLYYSGGSGHGLVLDGALVAGNTARELLAEENFAQGGGLFVFLPAGAFGLITDSTVRDNQALGLASGASAGYGGAFAWLNEAATLQLRRTHFLGNSVDADATGTPGTAGLHLIAFGTSEALLEDLTFTNNFQVDVPGSIAPAAFSVASAGSSELVLRRIRAVGNDPGHGGVHAAVSVQDTASASVTNLLLANGPVNGLRAEVLNQGAIQLGHLTVTEHGNSGLFLLDPGNSGSVTLGNSIAFDNNTDVFASGTGVEVLAANLVGTDPLFVNPALADYSLQATSAGVNTGDDALPTVEPYDLSHGARTVGAATDLGALERGALFGDGFEAGDLGAWATVVQP